MRIGFVTLGFHPYRFSGLDVSGERLVRSLVSQGITLQVITRGNVTRPTVEEISPHFTIHRLPLNRGDWISFGIQASRYLARLQSTLDVVHFWDVHFAYVYRKNFVASLHHSFRQRLLHPDWRVSSPLLKSKQWLYYTLARTLAENPSLKRATLLLAGSRTSQKEYQQHYHLSSHKIVLVPHGIDLKFFRPQKKRGAALRQKLGINPDEVTLMFAGFITPRKGLEYLFQALQHLSREVVLLLVGQWRDPKYRCYVLSMVPSRCRLIEVGYVPDHIMPVYYSAADIYVSTSILEGFGLPLAESMACGTPVIATNAGSSQEVVGPGGYIVPLRSPTSIAHALKEMICHPEVRTAMGRQGREHIEKNFSLANMTQAALSAYHQAITHIPRTV